MIRNVSLRGQNSIPILLHIVEDERHNFDFRLLAPVLRGVGLMADCLRKNIRLKHQAQQAEDNGTRKPEMSAANRSSKIAARASRCPIHSR